MPVSPGCYAAPLNDCDGGPLTREHFISEKLLEQFGKSFIVEGTSWARAPTRVSPSTLASRILCERHNSGLSSLDATMVALYRVIRGAVEGRHVGTHQFDGENVERWAIKLMLGAIASGNLIGEAGCKMAIPLQYLQVLFGREAMAEGSGFHYVGDSIDGFDADLMTVGLNSNPHGHAEEGDIFGVTVRFPGFQFVTTMNTSLEVAKQRVSHRPDGFLLGAPERGRIGLRWGGRQGSRRVLVLKMPAP